MKDLLRVYGAGLDGGRRTAGWGSGGGESTAGDGRRAGGARDAVPGEAADEAVREEDKVRGAEAQRGEAAADEGPIRQATCRCRRRRSCHCRPVRRHLACRCRPYCRHALPVRADRGQAAPVSLSRCECRGRWTTCRAFARDHSRARHEITDSEFVEATLDHSS